MIAAGSATRILVATKPVDFRRGAVGLAAVVAEHRIPPAWAACTLKI